jgi:hypothetical protein
VGLNIAAMLLIFFLVPETAGASVSKEHGKLSYMSLEELNYIFGVRTRDHLKYQFEEVLPWAGKMVVYHFNTIVLRAQEVKKPFLEKMYYWVAVKKEESSDDSEKKGNSEAVEDAHGSEDRQRRPSAHRERDADQITPMASSSGSPRLPRLSFESEKTST